MEEYLKLIKAINDKNRIRILKLLEFGPLCVCDITYTLGVSTSTVSAHLSILKDAGFIKDKKSGKWVYYEINKSSNNPIQHQLLAMIPGWLNDDLTINLDKNKLENSKNINLCNQ